MQYEYIYNESMSTPYTRRHLVLGQDIGGNLSLWMEWNEIQSSTTWRGQTYLNEKRKKVKI